MAQERELRNKGNEYLANIMKQEIANDSNGPGFGRYLEFYETPDKVTKKNIADCYDSAQHQPGYYGPSIYRAWCHLGGDKTGYYNMLRDEGYKALYEKYQQTLNDKKPTKKKGKKSRQRQKKSNERKVNKQQHEKIATKPPTLFTDVCKAVWDAFVDKFAEDEYVTTKSIGKYLNLAPKSSPKLSNDMQSLLAVSYLVKCFSHLYDTITPNNVRYYGALFFDDYSTSHPFSERRGSYGLVKEETNGAEGFYLSSEWVELFDKWTEFANNQIHKNIMELVEAELAKEDDDNNIESTENKKQDNDNETENDVNSVEDEPQNESHQMETNIHEKTGNSGSNNDVKDIQCDKDEDIGQLCEDIAQMCDELNIVLHDDSKQSLVMEGVTLQEFKELHNDDTLVEYMKDVLHLNPIQRRRIIQYIMKND